MFFVYIKSVPEFLRSGQDISLYPGCYICGLREAAKECALQNTTCCIPLFAHSLPASGKNPTEAFTQGRTHFCLCQSGVIIKNGNAEESLFHYILKVLGTY